MLTTCNELCCQWSSRWVAWGARAASLGPATLLPAASRTVQKTQAFNKPKCQIFQIRSRSKLLQHLYMVREQARIQNTSHQVLTEAFTKNSKQHNLSCQYREVLSELHIALLELSLYIIRRSDYKPSYIIKISILILTLYPHTWKKVLATVISKFNGHHNCCSRQ